MLFAKQCSKIDNSSELTLNFLKETDKSISAITFSCNDIATLIKNLDPHKAHSHDIISIRMLRLWKKANVVLVHKKGDKQIFKKYRPVSLLPICGKKFERLIYNNLLEYFIDNDLISQNQSGFKPGDSCIDQLTSTTHEIYQFFDDGLEVRGVFLDISKAFDKVWREGLIVKLKQNGIKGNLLDTLTNFLNDRKQRVVLNGQHSKWTNIEAGVPQGSILGPLPFLIYINELPDNLISNPKLFADNTSLFQ